jgi:hypothetical protein
MMIGKIAGHHQTQSDAITLLKLSERARAKGRLLGEYGGGVLLVSKNARTDLSHDPNAQPCATWPVAE